MREAHIIDVAREVITDEELLGAAVLQPQGAMEGLIGDSAGAGAFATSSEVAWLGAGQMAAAVQGVPRWTLVAVTPTRVVLLSVHSTHLLNVGQPEPFAEIDRAHVQVTRSGLAGAAWYALTDTANGRSYKLECSRGLDLANGNGVMKLIAGRELPENAP